ncbi:MAG TPA: thiamine-phosphate kinase, partial [Longimicrobium sp.]|nr:thiamine-phosphate kinase [Longimicrobium sp.]
MPPAGSRLAPGAEFDLIRRFLAAGRGGAHPGVVVGPGDDCAVVTGDGIALSVDMSVEGVHFRRDWLKPAEIGWRATAAALSDLAAVAARPIGVLASLSVPEADAGSFALRVMEGVSAAVSQVGGVLLGGDLTRSPGPLVVDVVAVGQCSSPVLRSGARPGDEVWVTGELGGSGSFVASRLAGRRAPAGARDRFARPVPRTREALRLRELGIPTAMLDISDGIAGDAAHIAAASGVAVWIDTPLLPVHPSANVDLALTGGEDYELCFTAAPGAVDEVGAEFAEKGVRL